MITDILWTMCSLYAISKTEQSHHLTDFFIRADSKGLVMFEISDIGTENRFLQDIVYHYDE